MKTIIRNFIIGIKNLYKYFPIVWNTRPSDYEYILDMMKFQLEILHESIKNGHEIEETRKLNEEDIKRVLELFDMLKNDSYLDNNKWNELWSIIRKGKKSQGMLGWWD